MTAHDAVAPERLHGLDALRGFALLLGVVLHATMSFLPGPAFWIVTDTDRSVVLAVAFFTIHMFRMATFFFVAGFFGHLLFHRLGASAFAKDRLKRIALPLVVGWPVLFVCIVAAVIWAASVTSSLGLPKPESVLPKPQFTFTSFPLTHLWFLYVLLLFYAVTVVVRGIVAAIDSTGAFRRAIDRLIAPLAGPLGPVALALPLAAALNASPKWIAWLGIPTPDNSLIPNAVAAIGYGTAFAFGWLLHREPGLLRKMQSWWAWHLCGALLATTACLALAGAAPTLAPAADDWRKLVTALLYAFGTWSWTFALTGIALRFFSTHSRARRYLADASYWIYLVHLPLVMALQVAMAQLHWPALVEITLLLALAFALMLASYHLMVRFSFVGAVLNGRRRARGE